MMKKGFLVVVLFLFFLSGSACNRAIVPDDVLEGLHKPVIIRISPAAVQINGAGFYLSTVMESVEDAQYVLYLNDRKVGQVNRGEPGYGTGSSCQKAECREA